jgi:hypothetical protein
MVMPLVSASAAEKLALPAAASPEQLVAGSRGEGEGWRLS